MAANPYLRRTIGGNATRVARQSGNEIVVSVQRAIANGITDALGSTVPKVVKSFGEFLSKDRLRTQFQAANIKIAQGAQKAYVIAYQNRTPRRETQYRVGDRKRLSGGRLLAALNSEKNIAGTNSRRISLIDTVHMKNEARHWQRLNFGSEEGRGGEPKVYTVKIEGQPVTQLQLPSMRGKAVMMPAGFWTAPGTGRDGPRVPFQKGGDDEFYPKTVRAMIPTQGIKATHYLDKGIQYVAAKTGPAYQKIFYNEVQNNRARLNKGLTYKVTADIRRNRFKITGPRPPTTRIR